MFLQFEKRKWSSKNEAKTEEKKENERRETFERMRVFLFFERERMREY
jgi:hypothetical protein